LQADRREYRCIAGHSLDCASASSGDINENLGESTGLEKTKTGSVAVASVFKVQQFMESSLRKSPSQLNRTPLPAAWALQHSALSSPQ
jgi:hypothetical protein